MGAKTAEGSNRNGSPPCPALRDELRNFKRHRILQEATTLFYERGFVGTSMDALAQSLGVSKPFIYQLFDSKEALLVEIYRGETERLLDLLDRAVGTDAPPHVRLAQFIRTFVQENIKYQPITSIFLQEEKHLPVTPLKQLRARQKQFDTKLAGLIEEGIKSGTFRVSDSHLASLAISGMTVWVQRWYKSEGELSVNEISDGFAQMALNMVGYQLSDPERPIHAGEYPNKSRGV